jgi:hypothetical protein
MPSAVYPAPEATVHPGPPATAHYWAVGGIPIVLLDYADPMMPVKAASGEETGLLFSMLLSTGMSILDAEASAMPVSTEFSAEVDGQALFIQHGPAPWFADVLDPDKASWLAAADQGGEIGLIIGSSQISGQDTLACYTAAAAGRLVGACIPVTAGGAPSDRRAPAR